ncbi:hypothetical protein FACS189461_0700 [Spirochaetia bacterium]|nr:hypothetical protein FACS189461_0700 [Spirochaetia bacterium]
MTLQQVFIANLKKFRKERGISQMILAELCGTSANYIGQIEMGRRLPSFEKIEEIAAALNVEPYRLLLRESGDTAQSGEKEPSAKDFLKGFPPKVKKEVISHLLAAISNDISASFNSKNY